MLVAIYPKQLIFFFGSSHHAVNKCGAVQCAALRSSRDFLDSR